MRRGRPALIAATCAAVLAGGGFSAVALREEPVVPPPPVPAATPAPVRPPLLASLGDTAAVPSGAGLQLALAPGLTDPALGGSLAISILDAVTGQVLYETDARQVVTPASTAKIATAVASLTALPADLRLATRVLAGSAPGEVVLVGGGDASLTGPLTRPGYPRAARIEDLARQARTALGATPVTRVAVDDSLYSGPLLGPGWRPQYVTSGDVAPVMSLMVDGARMRRAPTKSARLPDPALAAGRQLAALLGAPTAPVARGAAAPGSRELGMVLSPTVPQLVEAMLTRSDNDLAEALARQVAVSQGQPASFAGVATAMAQVLTEVLAKVGAPPASVRMLDGSGLSRLDRIQPGALTRLLASIAGEDRDRLFPVLSGLPVAGFDGTLEKRYRRGPGLPAAGVVRAKTGTLNGVSALAGLVRTRDGRLLAFDLTADAAPLGRTLATQVALDRLAAALAGRLRLPLTPLRPHPRVSAVLAPADVAWVA